MGQTLSADDPIHIVYFTDENYWYPVLVSAFSAAKFLSGKKQTVFHILHNGLSADCQRILTDILCNAEKHISIDLKYISEEPYRKFKPYHDSRMVYFRLDTYRLLPDIDWCIMVDGDTLWCKSPEEVWTYKNTHVHVVGSHDMLGMHENPQKKWCDSHEIHFNNDTYFCAGFFLFNLKRYREERLYEKAELLLCKHGMPPVNEQDVFNIVCTEKTLLPVEWGVFAKLGYIRDVRMQDIGCIHYVGDVPWKREKLKNLASDIVEMWWKRTKQLPVPLPTAFQGIHSSVKYWILRFLFKIWKNCSFLWHIKYLYVRFGNEWPQQY